MNFEEVDLLFLKIIEDIDLILNNDFYIKKGMLLKIREIFNKMYDDFLRERTLKIINVENLKFIDLEISDLFDMYVETESITNNYTERLLYDFSILEKMWRDEMLGGK